MIPHFIHIPKTAGRAAQLAFDVGPDPKHRKASEYSGGSEFVAVLRHPFSRALSLWSYHKHTPQVNPKMKCLRALLQTGRITASQFWDSIVDDNFIGVFPIFRPQQRWLDDPKATYHLIDFHGDLDSQLAEHYPRLLPKLPKANASHGKEYDYSVMLSPKAQANIKTLYTCDFELYEQL